MMTVMKISGPIIFPHIYASHFFLLQILGVHCMEGTRLHLQFFCMLL